MSNQASLTAGLVAHWRVVMDLNYQHPALASSVGSQQTSYESTKQQSEGYSRSLGGQFRSLAFALTTTT